MFLIKYFPEDIRNRKEMEFVKLDQGNMSVVDYAAKFEGLSSYYPFYVGEAGENSKCIKFETGLSRAEKAHYRNTGTMKDKRPMHHNRGKPYSFPPSKSELVVVMEKEMEIVIVMGVVEETPMHEELVTEIVTTGVKPRATTMVIMVIQLLLSDVTSVVSRVTWNMNVEMLEYDLIVNTPTSDYVDTSSVCLDIYIHVCGRDFRVDLVCLPLRLVDVILDMDWLSANRVRVDVFSKTIEFMESEERDKPSNISANQVKALLKEDAQLYMILA
ncbi:uncharacterized protein [Cicer arietinum]|uniref:uncharacterized protein n=1 Tax=Cicer arietinum TaxID=3827 RepID=UPI003CC5330A